MSGCIHPANQIKIEKGSEENYEYKFGRTPGIEVNTANKDNRIFIFFIDKKINEQEYRQKI